MPTLVTHWIQQCLTPSPHIIESPNLSLVQDLIFKHVLINIIRPIRHRWLITPSISQWLVATPNLVFSSPHCHIHGYAGARTHTHMHVFFQYVHITHKQNKWDSVKPNGGRIRIITMIFQCQHYPPNENSFFFLGITYTIYYLPACDDPKSFEKVK